MTFFREWERDRWSTASMEFDWREAMRRIARLGPVPKPGQVSFLRLYIQFGHYIRVEVADDFVLIDALRVLLPPYKGPGHELYRGVGDRGFDNVAASYRRQYRRKRKRLRTLPYGISWTASREVADTFALQHREIPYRGSAILQTLAPPEAIICRVPLSMNHQVEYLVDTRRLGRVEKPNWLADHWVMDTIE
jgi:hypothetical protein